MLLPLSLLALNPLDENIHYIPKNIIYLKKQKDVIGSYNNPGFLSISFSVPDKNGKNLYWFTKNNFSFYVGNKKIKNYLLSTSYSKYKVYFPRLPYQKKNGNYALTIKIKDKSGIVLSKTFNKYVYYTSPKINLILIVDTSVSMKLNDYDNYRQQAIRNILHYAEHNNVISKISIIKFSSTATTLCPLTSLHNRSVIEKAINEIDAMGETNIGDGLDKAFEQIKSAKNEKNIVILLTDGENNAPYFNNHLKFKKAGVPVYTIGLTKNVDNKFLNTIAETTGGEYYKIPKSFNIQNVYADIIHKEINQKIFIDQTFRLAPHTQTNVSFKADRKMIKLNIFSYWDYSTVYITTKEKLKQHNLSKFSNFQFFNLRYLKNKTYTFVIKNASEYTNSIAFSGFINSTLNITTHLPKKSFYFKEPVELSVLAYQDDMPLKNLGVRAQVLRPQVSSSEGRNALKLEDSGTYNDGKRNDGLYKAYFVPKKPGEYTIKYKITGKTLDNQSFTRYFVSHFWVSEAQNPYLQVLPMQIDMTPVGANIKYYRNFQVISDYTNTQSVSVHSIGKKLQIGIKPEQFLLESYKKKLFNVSVLFPKYKESGIFTGQILIQINNDFFLEPFTIDFYKYHIPENDELVK